MIINSVLQPNIYFCANKRTEINDQNNCTYRTTTFLFRDDTDWDNLENYLVKKYKDCDKVNVISHACSNGMEPYSFIMHLLSFHPLEANKFLPVTARDLSQKNIEIAKKGIYELDEEDIRIANYYTKNLFQRYMSKQLYDISTKKESFKIRPELQKHVNFAQSDIFNDVDNFPSKNVVLFCKNFWPYLPDEEQDRLAKKLSEKLDSSSVLIIGGYDRTSSDINNILGDNGFVRNTNVDYVYEKCDISTNSLSNRVETCYLANGVILSRHQ